MWQTALRPISQRLATAIGGLLTGAGMAAGDVNVILAAVPVALGFAVDLVIRRLY